MSVANCLVVDVVDGGISLGSVSIVVTDYPKGIVRRGSALECGTLRPQAERGMSVKDAGALRDALDRLIGERGIADAAGEQSEADGAARAALSPGGR